MGPGIKLWPQIYTDNITLRPNVKNIDYIFTAPKIPEITLLQKSMLLLPTLPPVQWRHEHRGWTVGQWKVAWSDASTFYFRSRG